MPRLLLQSEQLGHDFVEHNEQRRRQPLRIGGRIDLYSERYATADLEAACDRWAATPACDGVPL